MILALILTLILSAAVILLAACQAARLADDQIERFFREHP